MAPHDLDHMPARRRGLSRSQRALWAGRRLRPDDPAGNRVMKVEWQVALDPEAFARALDLLVAGTDALRLVFGETDGLPWQEALAAVEPDLEVRDFSAEADPFAAANRWLDARAGRVLDLSRKVFDTALARLGPERWIWFLNQHHIATDFVSASLLVGRLSDLYGRVLAGTADAVPSYPTFLDHLARHPEPAPPAGRTSERPAARPPRRARLYGARSRGPGGAAGGAAGGPSGGIVRHEATLDGARLARARARGALFNVLATAFVAYVSRVAGRTEVTFGALSHNRYRPEAQDVAGLFVRILPLHVEVGEGRTFAELADAVRRERRAVFAATRAGQEVADRRFDVALNFVPEPMPDFHGAPSREISPPEVVDTSGRDLRLSVRAGADPGSLRLLFDLDASVAAAAGGAEAAAEHFLALLDTLLDAPESAIDAAPLGGQAAHQSACAAATAAAVAPAPPHPTLVDAFLARAAETPEAPALSEGDRTMSYAALERASARVAAALIDCGAGPGEAVAVLVPRSMNLVVALMGVMRAGATFAALEPTTPPERARIVLEDTAARILLTSEAVPETAAVRGPERVEIENLLAAPAPSVPLPTVDPRAPVYYIHTSGTTGRPKCVVVPHESFARFTHWHHEAMLDGRKVVYALATSITFDASLRALTALWSGGCVRVVPDGAGVGETGLSRALAEDVADAVMTTPTQLRLVVDRPQRTNRLRTLAVLGESLPRRLATEAARAFGPTVEILNCYGPTEATLASTFHRFDPARDGADPAGAATDAGDSVPIGRPAPDVSVHVLDAAMNPVPRGVPGEIWIGGQRLADGYLGRPDLTAERFVDDPFRPGGRLYRTGDRGRVDGDDNLVHLGRVDDQIKINGVRIEPAEAERAICSHPRVRACAVAKQGDAPGRLVGWYVADDDIPPDELRAAAGRHVVPAMIPTRFLRIDALPLSPSGKVDRRTLADREDAPADPPPIATRGELPPAALEGEIAALWAGLLKVDRVGPHDDFFDLGGDSLAAVEMVHLVEDRFRVRLAAETMERIATVARLAALVAEAQAQRGDRAADAPAPAPAGTIDPETVRLLRVTMAGWTGEKVDRDGLIFSANGAGRRPPLVWCFNTQHEFEALARQLGRDQPLYAMRSLQGVLPPGPDKRRQALRLAEAYAEKLASLLPPGPCAIGGNCQAAPLAMRMARMLSDTGREVALLCLLEAAPPVPYPGRVALFFGRESETHNAFLRFAEPQIGWRRLYREVTWDIVPGSHGHYFEAPNLGPFAARIGARLAEALAARPPRLPDGGLAARIVPVAPVASFDPGERRSLEFELLNESSTAWHPGEDGGLRLANRWYPAASDWPAVRLDGATPLARRVLPGESCRLALDVRAPARPGRWVLQVELCEEGVAWASERGIEPLRIEVPVGDTDACPPPAPTERPQPAPGRVLRRLARAAVARWRSGGRPPG